MTEIVPMSTLVEKGPEILAGQVRGRLVVDPNASAEATSDFIAAARSTGADLVPSIVDHLPAGEMAAILAPTGWHDTLATLGVAARWKNYSTETATFTGHVTVNRPEERVKLIFSGPSR